LADSRTFPHDYRQLFAGAPRPVVVGGQAVNLWAILYLEPGEIQSSSRKYGSHDLDVLSNRDVLALLKRLPDWRFTPTKWTVFGSGITARAERVSQDGRKLLVEVLHSVAGLEPVDLKHTDEIELDGTIYRLLDPIAMLKAKAYNFAHFDQGGDPPRQDEMHLRIIATCVPKYLTDTHDRMLELLSQGHAEAPALGRDLAKDVSRTFDILTHKKFLPAIVGAGIDPLTVVPAAFRTSVEPKIAKACAFQLPRVAAAMPGTTKNVTPEGRASAKNPGH
jgi:hypothetical protein